MDLPRISGVSDADSNYRLRSGEHKAYTRHNTSIITKTTTRSHLDPRDPTDHKPTRNLKAVTGINDHMIDLNLIPNMVLDSILGKERELPIHR